MNFKFVSFKAVSARACVRPFAMALAGSLALMAGLAQAATYPPQAVFVSYHGSPTFSVAARTVALAIGAPPNAYFHQTTTGGKKYYFEFNSRQKIELEVHGFGQVKNYFTTLPANILFIASWSKPMAGWPLQATTPPVARENKPELSAMFINQSIRA